MSNFNYMDDVPVKIAEGFKRLPKVFQIPQAIANKLQLPAQHYYESPQFSYEFQLEKMVLEHVAHWRHIRQHDRELRRERKQKREELRLLAVEQQHKQMLGAVNYPDAEELSSDTDTDDEEGHENSKQLTAVIGDRPRLAVNEVGSFYNILQPTILPQSESSSSGNSRGTNAAYHSRNKSSSSFNYKDFEEDTSSPFDNIELKTINDLDILAQVLQRAQVSSREDEKTNNQEQENEKSYAENENLENSGENASKPSIKTSENNENVLNIEHKNSALQIADSSGELTIPTNHINSNNPAYNLEGSLHLQNSKILWNLHQFQQPHHLNSSSDPVYNKHNQNSFHSFTNEDNGSYYRSLHVGATADNVSSYNANTYPAAPLPEVESSMPSLQSSNIKEDSNLKIKHKSVPDILKELTNELRNSEVRHRNCSYDQQQNNELPENIDATQNLPQPTKNSSKNTKHSSYALLEASTQNLAKNISSMGFPLERVAKIAQMVGANDKKIIEHLIPLSELIDLGFDESEISKALFKFDNNKEQALDYLIS